MKHILGKGSGRCHRERNRLECFVNQQKLPPFGTQDVMSINSCSDSGRSEIGVTRISNTCVRIDRVINPLRRMNWSRLGSDR